MLSWWGPLVQWAGPASALCASIHRRAICHSHNLESVACAEGRWHRQCLLKRATQCNCDLRDFSRHQFCGWRGSLRSKACAQKAAPRLRAIETQHVFSFAAVNRRGSHCATGDRPESSTDWRGANGHASHDVCCVAPRPLRLPPLNSSRALRSRPQ